MIPVISQVLNNTGGRVEGLGNVSLLGSDVTNYGLISSKNILTIKAGELLNDNGNLLSVNGLNINAYNLTNKNGILSASSTLSNTYIDVQNNLTNDENSKIITAGTINLEIPIKQHYL